MLLPEKHRRWLTAHAEGMISRLNKRLVGPVITSTALTLFVLPAICHLVMRMRKSTFPSELA